MRLSLSSAAAPDASLADLLSAGARRGLSGLELVEGDVHGVHVGPGGISADTVAAAVREGCVAICGLYRTSLNPSELGSAAAFAASLGAPLVVPAGALPHDALAAAAEAFAAAGAGLLLAHGTDPDEMESLRSALSPLPSEHAVGLAWTVRPEHDDASQLDAVLAAAGPRLAYVRFHGGGPESERQTGRGVGGLMARLTLARFAGPLVLVPSDPRYHVVWRAWLGRAGGWGCGSKQSDPSLVTL